MITEDYVSFETAKLLKEKGFDEAVNCFYFIDGTFSNNTFNTKNSYTRHYAAPTHQMAMKWFRVTYNIFIEILHISELSMNTGWFFSFQTNKDSIGILFSEENYYKSYEEAVEAAIKYCLENLI